MYAGRVAEYILLGDKNEVTIGSSNDIKKASNLIKEYLTTYGMSNEYGMFDISVLDTNVGLNQGKIAKEASKIANDMYDKTVNLLENNKILLKKIAEKLLEKESLTNDELDNIINPQTFTNEIEEYETVKSF